MPKQINFEWQKWMTFTALAVGFFTMSYLMTVTMPDCSNCGHEPSAMQAFHVIFMLVFAAGTVGCGIASAVMWSDQ